MFATLMTNYVSVRYTIIEHKLVTFVKQWYIKQNSFLRSIAPFNAMPKLVGQPHTHNRFTALLEYVRDHPGEQVPER